MFGVKVCSWLRKCCW